MVAILCSLVLYLLFGGGVIAIAG
eukprot:COSAG05_NODE_19785_length_287_cov_18.000000_1_plen_23_part_01